MNRQRVSLELVEISEDTMDTQDAVHADGLVHPQEDQKLMHLEQRLYAIALNAAQGAGMALRLMHGTPTDPAPHNGIVANVTEYIARRKEYHADGKVTPTEHNHLSALIRRVHTEGIDLDSDVQSAVALLRTGADAPWVKRRLNERRKEHGLRLIVGGRSNDLQAG